MLRRALQAVSTVFVTNLSHAADVDEYNTACPQRGGAIKLSSAAAAGASDVICSTAVLQSCMLLTGGTARHTTCAIVARCDPSAQQLLS